MEVIIFLYQENILINYSLREILSDHKNSLFENSIDKNNRR